MAEVRHFSHEQIKLTSGLTLEASLSVPPERLAGATEKRLAVCLHPWSWLGGKMDDPYVTHASNHSLLLTASSLLVSFRQ